MTPEIIELVRCAMRDAMNKHGPYSGDKQAEHIAAAVLHPLARRHLEYWQGMPHQKWCAVNVYEGECTCNRGRAIAELNEVLLK